MIDVVAVMSNFENDSPVHIELIARGVNSEEEGFETMVEQMEGEDPTSVAYFDDDALVVEIECGKFSANIVIKADAEKIRDNASQISVYPQEKEND